MRNKHRRMNLNNKRVDVYLSYMIINLAKSTGDYELIDSGEGEKLERYGNFVLRRPDPGALWKKYKSDLIWEKADGIFVREGEKGNWKFDKNVPKEWQIKYQNLNFIIRPTSFKHIGLFPEQVENLKFVEEQISNSNRKINVLNLFAYTGAATLACAKAGAEVCHVDASKSAVTWASENAKISGLGDKPIRYIVDDCIKFLKREIKRGIKYDAIIMDPPAFGHGPKDELWKIDEDFNSLLNLCKEALSENPLFVLMSGYASGYSPIAYEQCLSQIVKEGDIKSGELGIESSDGGHILPCGIFARWKSS